MEICAAMDGRGGAWSTNGVIVFSSHLIHVGLSRVSADGGTVEPATLLDPAHGENSHRWPVFLPDGIHFLYVVRSIRGERRGVYVDASIARLPRPAHYSFNRSPMRSMRRSTTPGAACSFPCEWSPGGAAVRCTSAAPGRGPDDHRSPCGRGHAVPSVDVQCFGRRPGVRLRLDSLWPAARGDRAHRRAPQAVGGARVDQLAATVARRSPARLPAGRRDARQPGFVGRGSRRGSRLRITKDGVVGALPVWSPDGREIAYLTGTFGKISIAIAAADGTSVRSTVACPGTRCFPTDWSPDGRSLLANVYGSAGVDVWRLSIGTEGASRPLVAESYVERDGRLSPDGRLVAYVSEQTGRPEVSVHTVDGPLARDVLSVGGGDQPVWSRNGRELFFVDPQGSLRSVTVSRAPDGRPVFGRAVQLAVRELAAATGDAVRCVARWASDSFPRSAVIRRPRRSASWSAGGRS